MEIQSEIIHSTETSTTFNILMIYFCGRFQSEQKINNWHTILMPGYCTEQMGYLLKAPIKN